MPGPLRDFVRLFHIVRVLSRHGAILLPDRCGPVAGLLFRFLGRFADPVLAAGRPGQRLAAALEELGPTFVKFGQGLSTRSDLVGEEAAADLAGLRDNLPPFPGYEARAIVAEELGRPVDEIFQRFDDEAVAAASIAQVHFAVTATGEDVAVKILRPGVEEKFSADIALFRRLAGLAERLLPRWRRLRFSEVVKTFEDAVALEMDLRFEAAAAAEMAENFAGDDTFRVPVIHWEHTARRVLTMERVTGIPMGRKDELIAAGVDIVALTEVIADAFFNMVFRDGFFHADMHPGNLFVGAKGELIAVDFGITGRVDRKTRRYLGEMLLGFLTADYRRVAEVHFKAGYVPADRSVDAFTQAIRSIAEPIFGKPQNEISIARLLGQLFEVTETFSMEVQPQLLFLQKSMLVAEGLGRHLNPSANMWLMAEPLIEQWMLENLGPQARIRDAAEGFAQAFLNLPEMMEDVERTVAALRGGVKLHPDSIRDLESARRSRRLFPEWAPWLLIAILAALLLLD